MLAQVFIIVNFVLALQLVLWRLNSKGLLFVTIGQVSLSSSRIQLLA